MKKSATVQVFPGPDLRRTRTRPEDDAPSAPRSLSAEARARWRELATEYAIRDAAGLQLLATYGEAFDRMRSAQRAIKRDGQTTRDRWGQVKAHPLLSVERDARAGMLAALKALNLDIEPLRDRSGRPAGGA